MKRKAIFRRVVDAAMVLLLPVLMAYSLVGEALHEWAGIAMALLFIFHHWLNRTWLRNLFKGRYNAYRAGTALVNLVLFALMIAQMVSGLRMARYTFEFLPRAGRLSTARTLHLAAAYWSFVLMGLHAGMHLHAPAARLKKRLCAPAFEAVAAMPALAAIYGVWAFVRRGLPGYMFLRTQFAFFDFTEPLIFFLLDYAAILVLFALVRYALSEGLRCLSRRGTRGQ